MLTAASGIIPVFFYCNCNIRQHPTPLWSHLETIRPSKWPCTYSLTEQIYCGHGERQCGGRAPTCRKSCRYSSCHTHRPAAVIRADGLMLKSLKLLLVTYTASEYFTSPKLNLYDAITDWKAGPNGVTSWLACVRPLGQSFRFAAERARLPGLFFGAKRAFQTGCKATRALREICGCGYGEEVECSQKS